MTKLPDAACNQIVAALDLFFVGRYKCAITLAGAAEGMLPKPPLRSGHEVVMTASIPQELRVAGFEERNTSSTGSGTG
jgi:hypothetical protein